MATNFGRAKKQSKRGYSIWKKAVGATLLVLLLSTGFASFAKAETYNFVLKWGSYGSGDGQFTYPLGIAVDNSGNVYVCEANGGYVEKFDNNGNFLTKIGKPGSGDGQFSSPSGVAIDISGNIYVADFGNYRIQKFDSSGNFLLKWGSQGSGNGQFDAPLRVAVDGSGNVYVSDYWNCRIEKFDSSGNFLAKWGSYGSDVGQFNLPTGIAVDSAGNVYVSDAAYSAIEGNHRVQKFDSNGNFLIQWGSYGSGDGQFYDDTNIATDQVGNVYVCDSSYIFNFPSNDRVEKFDSNGNFLTKIGKPGSGDGQFNGPSAVAADNAGNIFVADYGNYRIEKFSNTYNTISLSSANIWVGLKNSDAIGIRLDLKAEVYKNDVLIGSGELDSVKGGSSGFNNANLNSIPLSTIGSPTLSSGDVLSIKLYVRNAAVGSGKNSGTARLWFNDAEADSSFGVTVNGIPSSYYLLSGFGLGTSQGAGPKSTIDVAAGAKGSNFKLFGTWNIVMP